MPLPVRREHPARRRHGRTPPADLSAALETYLDHLRVERGLSAATIRAYDTDLRAFGSQAPGVERWATDPEPALSHLAALGRPPGALRPSTIRRKAAAIRAFYGFCAGEELISVDVADRLELPRGVIVLPEVLGVDDVVALLEAIPLDSAVGVRDRAFLELLYASGLRVSEALGLDLVDLSTEAETVRVTGKGDRERIVPVGDICLAALDRYVVSVRPGWLAMGGKAGPPGRSAVPVPAWSPDGAHGGLAHRPAVGRAGGAARPCDPAHVAA